LNLDVLQACEFSNMYAPEHLIVNVEDAEQWLDTLDNAGKYVNFQDFDDSGSLGGGCALEARQITVRVF